MNNVPIYVKLAKGHLTIALHAMMHLFIVINNLYNIARVNKDIIIFKIKRNVNSAIIDVLHA